MIISYKYRYIFIHCRKVAGSALTAYLNRFLGPEDLQVGSWQDALGSGGSFNRKFLKDLAKPRALLDLSRRVISRRGRVTYSILNSTHKSLYRDRLGWDPAHPRATELRDLDPGAWESHFKFCFVRNPYERAVSDYIWRVESRKIPLSFREYLLRVCDRDRPDPEKVVPRDPDNWPLYTIDGRIAVDFVGRYENLEADFRGVCEKLGLPLDEGLPVAKKKVNRYDYRDWYGNGEKDLVERIYVKEIETFGYGF